MNVVPSAHTRQLANLMVRRARKDNGADAVVAHLGELQPNQCAALIGHLLQRIAMDEVGGLTGGPAPERAPIQPREDRRCSDCLAGPEGRMSRGLCAHCYAQHRWDGTLTRYARVRALGRKAKRVA